ncbi:MAG TPA: DnaA regulatory inactivator Hda [Gammaproteobacteria bacterium]|nr:DnaA regulatory inactivator Hda [Gammaproteobacteria bacterium]
MIKSNLTSQLTLGVGLKDQASFTNYVAGRNSLLVEELKKSAEGCGERVIYFYGAGAQGNTHLLEACCHEADRHGLSAAYLPLANWVNFSPDIFEGLESRQLVCLDDIQVMAGKAIWEEAFFHAYNRIHDAGGQLIMAAKMAPRALGFSLPDIVSRLSWGIVFQLQALTDEEKLQLIIMRATLRGMTLSEEVGKFILTHSPRHVSTLFAALDVLDKVSLAAQRKLTIPFVKTVLEI